VVLAPNDFYSALGQGVKYAAARYGGEDIAIHLGGLEIPGYHTGLGNIVGLSVGVRHSHLDNAGYSADQKALKKGLSDEGIIDLLIAEDDLRGVLNSLTICLFARSVYKYDAILEALNAVGISKTEDELKALGRDIFNKRYELKKRFGFDLGDLSFPSRFFETASTTGLMDEDRVRKAIDLYRAKRGL
jgi:aldehyde:ferredoxin oxidoreductase